VRRLFPDPDPTPLDDDGLTALYAPADRDRPALRVNFVSSLDGAVTVKGASEGLSGSADKRVFGLLRTVCDALVVAAGTLRHEGYGPVRLDEAGRAWRRARGLPGCPPLVVVSRALTLDPALPALAGAPVRPYVVTCAASPARLRRALGGVAEVLVHGDTEVDLPAAVADLHERGLRQLLCEGGPHLLGGLTAADLVDELCLTVSPLLVGAGPGRMAEGVPAPAPHRLALRHVVGDGDVLFLRYARPPSSPRS
jgi:riboflavin biosynthesis pyrimidine reductase